jgi:hypothetical protein
MSMPADHLVPTARLFGLVETSLRVLLIVAAPIAAMIFVAQF